MKLRTLFTLLLLLFAGAVMQLNAQVAVTVGSQVTDASKIVSGKAYILQSQAAGTGTLPFINDNGTGYDIPMSNSCTEASVYYLISNGDGTWKIKNYYTNRYWGVPVNNQAIASVAEEASAGAWSLNFSNGIAYPSALDAESTVRGLDRSSNKLWGYTTGTGGTKQVKIYEVGPTEKGLTKPVEIGTGWYLIKWVDTDGDTNTEYTNDDVNGKFIRNYSEDVSVNDVSYPLYLADVPTGTDEIALSLIYFEKDGSSSGRGVDGYLRSTNGHYVTNTGAASNSKSSKNFIIYRSSGTPNYSVITSEYTGNRYSLIPRGKDATPYIGQAAQNKFPVGQFYSVDFSLYGIQPWAVEFDGEEDVQVTYSGSNIYGLKSVYNGGSFFFDNGVTPTASDFSAPTRLGSSPDIEVDETNRIIKVTYNKIDIHNVYTINNTNTNRGALIYNPDASTKYVWSSGKSGTFDPSSANSQWVIIPTETSDQYYLYNVGAGKFAIPTAIAQGSGNSWVFSNNAVAVIFETQSDGTKKIKMATNPVNGTNAAYMAVSNSYTGPIINYNDAGGNFTITKVDGDQSEAANAAVAKLVKSQTPLTSYPQATGWYAIQIKSKTGAASYSGRYLQNSTTLYSNLYPLTFTGAVDVQPAITDPTFLTYINCTSWDVNTWQMPDGRYLVDNGNNKFPTPSATPGNVICGYDNGNYFKSSANYYADPYNSNANYFIGETSYMRTAYTVYPVDLEAAGLTAWQMICDNAPETAQISCTRTDVVGLTSVYKNGFIFLPIGVTPEGSNFVLEGVIDVSVNAEAKTVELNYNPDLAFVEGGVTVAQGYQTAGRGEEVMLLKVNAAPFRDATDVSIYVTFKDGSEANISKLTLYKASTSSPEILSAGNAGAPTKTLVDETTVSGANVSLAVGNLPAGEYYYWLGATVKEDATLGAVLDAAVTSITYTCNSKETTLDLTSIGDPADRGAMVFNVHSYPFLPRDNGSRVYRIPAMTVADDGSIVVACDKRYESYTDIGKGHVIDIVIRRSTDGGKTWSEPVTIAKGLGTADDNRCGYGDPSLVKGKDGKIYCLFAAGNLGYFYGQKHICMSTSTDNGVTWSSSESNPPVDLFATDAIQNATGVGAAGGYGLYDYFVTSGKGLYTSDGILMYLIPAQTLTADNYTMSDGTYWSASSDDYLFYSTDDGATWYFSETPMIIGGDEAKVIEMNNGSLFGSIRKGGARRFNTATYTRNEDGTLNFNFGTQWDNNQLTQSSQNNQDILYYQRETVTGKKDFIFHSITTGNHTDFKLYYSTDQGANWTEFLTVQTKGTRYVTMDKSGTDEDPGSLYLFFEDQSLNSAGGYTDYNHYPLNFIEITREQLLQYIPDLDDKPAVVEKDVKIVYQSSGEATYGSWNGLTWTSSAASGVAGLTMTLSDGSHDKFSSFNSLYNMAYHPAAANTNSTITLTAPDGYVITGYSVQTGVYQAATYTLTPSGSESVAPANLGGTYTPLNVSGISTPSTSITVTTTDASKWLCLANFVVTLKQDAVYTRSVTSDNWGTICVPGAVASDYINGAEIYRIVGKVMKNNLPTELKLEKVEKMEAGKPYLFRANSGQLSLTYLTSSIVSTPRSENGLIGSFERMDVAEGMYLLSNNTIVLCGTGCNIGANRAYIDMSEVPVYTTGGNEVKSIKILADEEDPDGINELTPANGKGEIYDLSGRRVNSKPKKGIYIVDGIKKIF